MAWQHLFNVCNFCHKEGLRPGILLTAHGDFGARGKFKDHAELQLDRFGRCPECSEIIAGSMENRATSSDKGAA